MSWRERAKPAGGASGGSWKERAKPVDPMQSAAQNEEMVEVENTKTGDRALFGAAHAQNLGDEWRRVGDKTPAPQSKGRPALEAPVENSKTRAFALSGLNSAAASLGPQALAMGDAVDAIAPRRPEEQDETVYDLASAGKRVKGVARRTGEAIKNLATGPDGTFDKAVEAYAQSLPQYRGGFGAEYEREPVAALAGGVTGGMLAGPKSVGQSMVSAGLNAFNATEPYSSAPAPSQDLKWQDVLANLYATGEATALGGISFAKPITGGALSTAIAAERGDTAGMVGGAVGMLGGAYNRAAKGAANKNQTARKEVGQTLVDADHDVARDVNQVVRNSQAAQKRVAREEASNKKQVLSNLDGRNENLRKEQAAKVKVLENLLEQRSKEKFAAEKDADKALVDATMHQEKRAGRVGEDGNTDPFALAQSRAMNEVKEVYSGVGKVPGAKQYLKNPDQPFSPAAEAGIRATINPYFEGVSGLAENYQHGFPARVQTLAEDIALGKGQEWQKPTDQSTSRLRMTERVDADGNVHRETERVAAPDDGQTDVRPMSALELDEARKANPTPDPITLLTPDEVKQAIREAGFSEEQLHAVGQNGGEGIIDPARAAALVKMAGWDPKTHVDTTPSLSQRNAEAGIDAGKSVGSEEKTGGAPKKPEEVARLEDPDVDPMDQETLALISNHARSLKKPNTQVAEKVNISELAPDRSEFNARLDRAIKGSGLGKDTLLKVRSGEGALSAGLQAFSDPAFRARFWGRLQFLMTPELEQQYGKQVAALAQRSPEEARKDLEKMFKTDPKVRGMINSALEDDTWFPAK